MASYLRGSVFQQEILKDLKEFPGPLFFLFYINNLAKGLDTFNHELAIIQNWAFQWKMTFNPDPTKQAK